MIVQELYAIQQRHGFLPEKDLRGLAARSGTHLHRLHEVASFFPHFRLQPAEAIEVRICQDMSCQMRGSCELIGELQNIVDRYKGTKVDVRGVSCLGRCDRAPAAFIVGGTDLNSDLRAPTGTEINGRRDSDKSANDSEREHQQGTEHEQVRFYLDVDRQKMESLIEQSVAGVNKGESNFPPSESDILWRPEQVRNWSIDIYQGLADDECYRTIRQFVARRTADSPQAAWHADESLKTEVEGALRGSIRALDEESQRIFCSLYTANLLGMGGAGGRTYKKWFEVLEAKGDVKYVVCNGDESEPGTFKDREILLRAPHLVVEAVTLAGLLLGAERGYIYIRHEFGEQIAAIEKEIRRAELLKICGNNILGSGVNFSVEVFVSPGGYICGEQTALIEAMEDKRAEPRNRPPELQTNGLWNCPTLLNNVETFAWVPAILLKEDGRWFEGQGSDRNRSYKGRRFFSISGDVAQPGAFEVPIGITLGELISDFAGGMADGRELKAAALSGPSGGFTPRRIPVEYLPKKWVSTHLPAGASEFDILNLELDIQATRDMGIMMGAGMVVFADSIDMVATALSATTFYRNESCGKCVPCRIGSQKLVELLADIANRKFTIREIYGDAADPSGSKQGLVSELAETMKLTAICGLGTVASNPLTTLLNYFRADVERYAKV